MLGAPRPMDRSLITLDGIGFGYRGKYSGNFPDSATLKYHSCLKEVIRHT